MGFRNVNVQSLGYVAGRDEENVINAYAAEMGKKKKIEKTTVSCSAV